MARDESTKLAATLPEPASTKVPPPAGRSPPARQVERIKVALLAGSDLHPTTEVQVLLRRRLRVLSLIWLVVLTLSVIGISVRTGPIPENLSLALAPFMTMLIPAAACAGLLWSGKRLSLVRLRLIELIEFGVLTAGFGWQQYQFLRAWLPIFAAQGITEMDVLGTFCAHIWSVIIVTYGMFIPNTWRRSTAVVGLMVLTPMTIYVVIAFSDPAIDRSFLAQFLSKAGVLLLISAAIAILGSHRIEVLRQQVFVARKLGQYQLKQRLGTGGMGEVYLAEHALLQRPCAIKLIRPERAGDSKHLLRFEREVQITATLTHPNTVQVFDYGRAADGTFYYVMEYLPGLNLEQLVNQEGALPPERAVHFLRQVCGALREAHAIGLIHRDIKPSNIIVCERGQVYDVIKLLDFGLVHAPDLGQPTDQITQEGSILGTPAYMSPEQASGKELDARSDIYSLGAVAYFLLSGRPPFVQDTPMQTLAAHICQTPAPLAGQYSELLEVVMRCLEKLPENRFPNAASLEHALVACPVGQPWTQERAGQWWEDNRPRLLTPGSPE